MSKLMLLMVLLISISTACSNLYQTVDAQEISPDVTREVVTSQQDIEALVTGNTEFAFEIYHHISENTDGNLVFSPYSISLAFTMLYAGADGETKSQMADVLGHQLPQEQLHSAFGALDMTLQPPQEPTPIPSPTPTDTSFIYDPADDLTLTIANALWGQEGLPIEDEFLEILAQNYGAGLGIVDFSGNVDEAQRIISQWVEDATRGRIKDMPSFGAISPATRLLLTNAVYFQAEWTYPFQTRDTYDGTFHKTDDEEIPASIMVNDFAYMRCARAEDYHAVELTYGDPANAAMLIVLPDAGRFDQIEQDLDAEIFQEMRTGLFATNLLAFSMPRFKFETETNLIHILSSMGMIEPFSDKANYTGISPNDLFIDYAEHKATISVDEQGTEATGVTMTAMALSGLMSECGNEVIANRPFIFAIYDFQTSTILFLGRVMNPVE